LHFVYISNQCTVDDDCDRIEACIAALSDDNILRIQRATEMTSNSKAEDAGQLFVATIARSEGERRGADAGEESPQRPSGRGAGARREPGRDTRHLRRALRVRRRARRGRPGTREGLGPCRSAADQADHNTDQSVRTTCPCCKARVTARAPADMPGGSPFGPGIKAAVATGRCPGIRWSAVLRGGRRGRSQSHACEAPARTRRAARTMTRIAKQRRDKTAKARACSLIS
jgi:hypothetical protein